MIFAIIYWFKLISPVNENFSSLSMTLHILLILLLPVFPLLSCSSVIPNEDAFMPSCLNEEKDIDVPKNFFTEKSSRELLFHIGEYFTNPVRSFGCIGNCTVFNTFHSEFNMKSIIMHRFNIKLEGVDENESELAGILSLSWCRNDPFIFFRALMEDVVYGKKPYMVLFRPLILYLARSLKDLSEAQRIECYNSLNRSMGTISFDFDFAKSCINNGHYDLVFDFLKEKPNDIILAFSRIEDKESFINFFKSNEHFAIQYRDILIRNELNNATVFGMARINFTKWIGNCIHFDAPIEFYSEIFNSRPILLKEIINDLFNHLSGVPVSEYPRIHIQIRCLFDHYMKPISSDMEFDYFNLINDIRFGSEDLELLDFSNYDNEKIFFIAESALMGNKRHLFLAIYNRFNTYSSKAKDGRFQLMDMIMGKLQMCDPSIQKKDYKVIYELFASGIEKIPYEKYYFFIKRLYAIKGLKQLEFNRVAITFSASQDLIALGYPPRIHFETEDMMRIKFFIEEIFSSAIVNDEETILSFLDDFKKFNIFQKDLDTSIELLEFIADRPILIQAFKDAGIKLRLTPLAGYLTRFASIPNIAVLYDIILYENYGVMTLLEFKSVKQLEAIDKAQNVKLVHQYFLNFEASCLSLGMVFNRSDYFLWRVVFSYWIKNQEHKNLILEINSPAIIEMLEMEFPEEMAQIKNSIK